jgi:hypothetical protein
MANERRPQQGQMQRLSPEQVAEMQEMDRQWRLEFMPPQVDVNGMERVCMQCHSPLHPWHNQNYDGSTGGFCNKLCMKAFEGKLLLDGKMSIGEATNEVEKYEDWKPKRHSPIV